MSDDQIEARNNEAAQRFEVQSEGCLAVLEYERDGNHMTLVHTEVPTELEGRGIAGRLAQTALETARAQNLTVVPVCEFVAGYLRRHREYLPLVDPASRARLE